MSHKQILLGFEELRQQIKQATVIDAFESYAEKTERIKRLLDNPVEFMRYYFPHYVIKDPASFHKRFAKEMKQLKRGILVKRWFRGGSKSTVAMMLLIYRAMAGLTKCVIYASKTVEKANKLLGDLQAELMENQRLINDFGEQFKHGSWEQGEFVTRNGVAFFALGKGQSPRGLKNRNIRPDTIVVDDIDDEEELRNPKRLDESFEWLMGALFGCFGALGGLFVVLNNKIAEDCLVERVSKMTGAIVDIVHLTDKNGVSTWPQVFTQEAIDFIKNSMPEYLFLREYYEKIIKIGKVFKPEWFIDGKVPPLSSFQYLVTYTDPGFKNTGTADSKAVVLLGLYKAKWYIIKVFVNKDSVKTMISWHYEMYKYILAHGGSAQMWMEQVFLQDLLFKDFAEEALVYGYPLPLAGDIRKKPDKDTRILATSFHFEKGNVIFNEEEKDNHHMRRLKDQYSMFQPGVKTPKDGPDAVEGGMKKIEARMIHEPAPIIGTNKPSGKHKIV